MDNPNLATCDASIKLAELAIVGARQGVVLLDVMLVLPAGVMVCDGVPVTIACARVLQVQLGALLGEGR